MDEYLLELAKTNDALSVDEIEKLNAAFLLIGSDL